MLTIHLNNLSFFSFHGLYEEERINGNFFTINATVDYQPTGKVEHIEQTIDYTLIYELIKRRMSVATPLLETVVMDIAHAILEEFTLAEIVHIQLIKQKPPIPDFDGSVGVSFKLKR